MSDETTTADPAAPPTPAAERTADGAVVAPEGHAPEPPAAALEAPATAAEAPADEVPVAALPPHDAAEAATGPAGPAVAADRVDAPVAEPEPAAEREPVRDEAPAAMDEPADETVADEDEPVAPAEGATAGEAEPEPGSEPAGAVDEAEAEPEPAGTPGEPVAAAAEPPPESNKKWYVVKVQSNREESIKGAIERQVKIQGLEDFFGQIVIPVEEYYEKKKVTVKDKKTGQKVTEERNVAKHRKKFPGYLFAEVEFNDRILYVFRETSGVGDFVGATHHRAPSPMPDREVQQMLTGVADPNSKDPKRKVKVKLDFEKGDKVRIRDGAFAGSEAEVKAISEPKDPTDPPKVTVVVTIWGRPVEMELESFQVDKA